MGNRRTSGLSPYPWLNEGKRQGRSRSTRLRHSSPSLQIASRRFSMNKFVFLLPLTGLCVSLLIIGHDRSKADSLKQSVAHKASGTGYICNGDSCNNGDGCVSLGSAYITWYPKLRCTFVFSSASCTNFAFGKCWHKDYYAGLDCPNGIVTSTGNFNDSYCAPGP